MTRSAFSRIVRWSTAIAIVGVLAVLVRGTDLVQAFATHLSIAAILVALVAYNLDVAIHACAGWLGILRLGHPAELRTHIAATYVSRLGRVAGFSASGLAARVAYLRWRSGIPVSVSILVLTHYQLVGTVLLVLIAVAGALLSARIPIPELDLSRLLFWAAAAIAVAGTCLAWSLHSSSSFAGRMRHVLAQTLRLNSAPEYLTLAAAGRLATVLSQACVLLAVGYEAGTGFWECIAVAAVGALTRILNLVPASIGVYEGMLVGSGAILGIPYSVSLAMAVAMRCAEIITLATATLVLLLFWRESAPSGRSEILRTGDGRKP